MTTVPSVEVIAEDPPAHRALVAIFQDERANGALRVSSYGTSSAAIGGAEMSLLEQPEIGVALVLNAGTADQEKIEEERRILRRILSRASPSGWHIAMAIPDVDAWIMADPRVRRIFESDPTTRENRYARAARIVALAKEQPLNREEIGKAFPEFQALVDYIAQKVRVPQPTS